MRKVWDRPLRACGRLLAALVFGMLTLVMAPLTLVVALALPFSGVGTFLASRWVRLVTRWADWNRLRAARWLGVDVPDLPRPPDHGFRALVGAPATHRVLLWMPLFSVVSILLGCLALIGPGMLVNTVDSLLWWAYPAGFQPEQLGYPVTGWGVALPTAALQFAVGLAILRWATVPMCDAHARMCVRSLAPSEQEVLAHRVDELQRTRAGVVDAHGAELRRIERDLHDGTQARLVAIAMQLGVAKEAASDPAVAALLEQAHTGTEEAMTELRDVIRGIYPPILADRGLPGALTALAGRTTLPVRLDVTDPGTLPVAVETAAYYAVTESVTNAVRHSGAETISVRLAREDDLLRVEVSDDGHGGVDESAGSGVRGLRRRAAALDGNVTVHSPAGGPTTLRVELPCGS
ncbi:sensor histidine kinase [Nocardiopsis sp. L17-MgMaSL7]|uniref:sensor histidine kinase n=1 Tax=Nocardiopsis sp. L17-MgMaSL7 TaxID=1938893 RepID=UPI000D70F019|nr:sensor histidine kinase [Nocardiopsis sp. L17-MgMaSL7]PWV52733.1 signal transduction histidine kinase [Nocardiopsis sp. L17-MgMaSL7]